MNDLARDGQGWRAETLYNALSPARKAVLRAHCAKRLPIRLAASSEMVAQTDLSDKLEYFELVSAVWL